jgi:hypothetical protein
MKKNKTPKEAIRAYCRHCTGGNLQEVEMCSASGRDPSFHACPLYPYRTGKKRPSLRVLREFCLQCMGGNKGFILDCTSYNCLVYPFRLGKNPNRAGIGSSRERMIEISQKRMAMSR